MFVNGSNLAEDRYAAIKGEIDRRFPAGQFVAVEGEQVIADAATHRELVERLKSQGRSPKGMLIVEAGVCTANDDSNLGNLGISSWETGCFPSWKTAE